MKKVNNFRKIGIMFVLVMLCTMILNPIATAQEFSDLRPDHWCYNKIVDFEERGYVTGYDDGEFKPDRIITRAEYVTIVNNFFGYATSAENTAKFSDVSEDDWFEPYVSEAVKRGYISGYPDGTFRPYEPIRRQEATVILSKILNIHDEDYPVDHEDGLAQYDDGDEVEDWAYKAVHSYSVYNFINGYEDNTIRLFRDVTRAETVQLLNTVEEKVVIDRDNKTNQIKNRPSSHKKRTATPIITVVETNDTNTWYNKREAREDGKVTVEVTTTTNAAITVKVNGEDVRTISLETAGTGVTFDLPEGKYEIVASATRSGYKASYEAKSSVDVDVTAPKVSGKVGDMGVSLSATDNLSGVDEIQYAWFIKDAESYKRVSNWAELEDYVELPKEPQNYYIGVKGSDMAGNKIDDGLTDNNSDSSKVTDDLTEEPYEIVNEAKVIDGKDEEQNPEDEPQVGENAITYYKNDGTDANYVQKLTVDSTVLKEEIFSRDQYKLIGWTEIATGNKVYDLGETVNFTENKDLYAVWQLNEPSDKPVKVEVKVSIKFVPGENGALDGEANINVAYDTEWSTITVPTPKADTGYKFVNWTPSFPETITSNATYTANFEKDASQTKKLSYKVEYYKDGTHVETDDGVVSKDVWINDTTLAVDTVNTSNDKYIGYKFAKTEPSEIPTTIANGGVIKVYYVKDENQWHTVTFKAGTNGTFEETELEYSDILEGTQLGDTDVVIPKPKANSGYEFDSWTPSTPTKNTVVNEDLVFTANFKEIWQAPHVTIDKFESTNVSNDEGNRAEPGTKIEYKVVITNNDTKDAIIDIDPERGMSVVSPEPYENIELKPGESITVVVKKTVPKDYSVADDFDADIDVIIKSDKTESADTEKISESTSNKIEKTTTISSGEPVSKNIVLTIDVSGSMLFCCTHEEKRKLAYRYDKDFVTPGGYYDVYWYDGYKWSKCPYAGHYYKVSKDYGRENWVKCTDSSRIDVVKAALTSFVDNVYNASVANGEEVTITLVTFSGSAESSDTYLLTEENVKELKNIITSINATGETNIKEGVTKATKAYSNSSMLTGENVENYSIFFGDGEPSDNGRPGEDDYTNLKNAVDYSYAIGFGPDFSNTNSSAYKILNNLVKGEGVKVTQAKTAIDVTNAFTDIAAKIATSQQSDEGEVVVTVSNDGKYYPIVATYNDNGEIVTLFTVNNSSELAENDIEIKGTTLTWDISGTKYSSYEGLSIKLGTKSPEEEIQPRIVPAMLFNAAPVEINTINAVMSPVVPEVKEELKDDANQNDSDEKPPVSEADNSDEVTENSEEDKPTDESPLDTPAPVQKPEDETKNEEDKNVSNESTNNSIQAQGENEPKADEKEDEVPEKVVEEPSGAVEKEEIDEPNAELEQKDDGEESAKEKTDAESEEEPVETTDSTQPTENNSSAENGEKQPVEEQTVTEQSIASEN